MSLPIALADFDVASQHGLREVLGAAYKKFKDKQHIYQSAPMPHASTVKRSHCPSCQTSTQQSRILFIKNDMPHAQCLHCHLVYSHVILDQSTDAALYDNTAFMRSHLQLKLEPLYVHLEVTKARYFLQRALQHQPSIRTVLDIGASTGAVMTAARIEGLDGYGIEPNSAIEKQLRQAHGDYFCRGFFPQDIPGHWPHFALITLLDVLEHIADPLPFLAAIRETLSNNAILLIQVPNLAGLLMQLEGEQSANYCVSHWQHFTSATLTSMMERAGFKTLEIGNCISELDHIQSFPDEKIQSVLHQHLGKSVSLTPGALYENQLGYKLYGLFQPGLLSSTDRGRS